MIKYVGKCKCNPLGKTMKRHEHWKKKKEQEVPGVKWLRRLPQQEAGIALFSVCSWEPNWKVLW